MKFNDFRIQLATALPGVEAEPSRKDRTFLADIVIPDGVAIKAYVKLLPVEDIAREALCAVLARKLHLPMLRPFYVSVDPSYTGNRQGNIQHVAFGIEKDILPAFRVRGQEMDTELRRWSDLERCAIFDEWIGNRDRYPNNLLYAGNKQFTIFDHDEALPDGMSATALGGSNLLDMLVQGKQGNEFELHRLSKKLMGFAEDYKTIDWTEIMECLAPENIPGIDQHFKRFITLLAERAIVMRQIVEHRLGIRQIDWTLAPGSGKADGRQES
jgi:hypothetical protein